MIIFKWNKKSYRISDNAVGSEIIQLPDGTLLRIRDWNEKTLVPNGLEEFVPPRAVAGSGTELETTRVSR